MSVTDQVPARILEGAEHLFMRFGVRSISMDEVARHLAMSKKTLYQYFDNKDELVFQVAVRASDRDCQDWLSMHDQFKAKSALEETMAVGAMMRKKIAEVNPVILFELKRYHPRAWREFTNKNETQMEGSIAGNILRGQAEGVYHAFLKPRIIAKSLVVQVMSAFDHEIFPPNEFTLAETQEQLLEHFVRGLLTPSGQTEWERLRADRQHLLLSPSLELARP
jgi:AcrR family transcriptional regulator